MVRSRVVLALVFVFAPSWAQDGEKPAEKPPKQGPLADWLTVSRCREIREEIVDAMEELTRIRFRRRVPIEIMPKARWQSRTGSGGIEGYMANHAPAFYTPGTNTITMVPWVMDYPQTDEYWADWSRRALLHEMAHALHHQNFWTAGRHHAAGRKIKGLTEEEIDGAVMANLLTEGFAQLVQYTLTRKHKAKKVERRLLPGEIVAVERKPAPKPEKPLVYMKRYVPDVDAKEPFRVKLLQHVYRDGLTLMYYLMLEGGMRAVRSVLYRRPHRLLIFQPSVLAEADLDDPPEPDAIFRFLHPGPLSDEGILLATGPGAGRYFGGATRGHDRGCLLGYTAKAPDGPLAGSEYSFFLADPDRPSDWMAQQHLALTKLATSKRGRKEKKVALPLSQKVSARLTTVTLPSEAYAHASVGGIVVIARIPLDKKKSEAVRMLEQRVLLALRALYIKKPTKDVFVAAMKKAQAEKGYGR